MTDNTLIFPYMIGGLTTIYAVLHAGGKLVRVSDGSLIDGSAESWPSAAIACTDAVMANSYLGTIPSGAPTGTYVPVAHRMAASTPAPSDDIVGVGLAFYWTGAAAMPSIVQAPSDPGMTTCYMVLRDGQLNPVANKAVWFELERGPDGEAGVGYVDRRWSILSDHDGMVVGNRFLQGGTYKAWVSSAKSITFTVPGTDTYALPDLLV